MELWIEMGEFLMISCSIFVKLTSFKHSIHMIDVRCRVFLNLNYSV